jgi:hypothetical protein
MDKTILQHLDLMKIRKLPLTGLERPIESNSKTKLINFEVENNEI